MGKEHVAAWSAPDALRSNGETPVPWSLGCQLSRSNRTLLKVVPASGLLDNLVPVDVIEVIALVRNVTIPGGLAHDVLVTQLDSFFEYPLSHQPDRFRNRGSRLDSAAPAMNLPEHCDSLL